MENDYYKILGVERNASAEEIKKAKELLDMGVISEVDFEGIKQKLIAKL